MNWLSSFTGALASAVVLTAFALPANAAKTISLAVSPATLTPQTTTVTAKITNTGNSNANSFEIDWKTTPGFAVTSASVAGDTGTCSTTGSKGAGWSSCTFLKQLPTKSSVTITLNVALTNQCTAISIDWFAFAWTGSPGSVSQAFTLSPGSYVTASTPNCEIKFLTQPTNAFAGSAITGVPLDPDGGPVQVELRRYGAPASGSSVSVTASPGTCAAPSALQDMTDASGIAEFEFTAAAPGACTLTASASGYPTVDSDTFDVVESSGVIDCGDATIRVGNGTTLPIGQCTRLDNVASTLEGGSGPGNCQAVNYNLTATPGALSLTHEVNGTQDATQFKFICTAYWLEEELPFDESADQLSAYPLSKQSFGPDNVPATRDVDYCPGATVTTDPSPCDPDSPDSCKVVDFDLTGIPASMQDMAPPVGDDDPVPGDQKGCLLDERVLQCNSSDPAKVCVKQTWGWEGDAIISRRG